MLLFAFVLFLLVALGAYENFRFYPGMPARTRPDWMFENRAALGAKTIARLRLPGTHGSGAYQYQRGLPFFKNWVFNQRYSVAQQLEIGVRALDLRLTRAFGVLYVSHYFLCVPLDQVLREIRTFLESHKGELVLVFAKSDYTNRPHDFTNADIERALQEGLGGLFALLDETATVASVVASGKRALVSVEKSTHPAVWLDADNLADFDARLQQVGAPTAFANVHAVLTPNATFVAHNLATGVGTKSLAADMRPRLPEIFDLGYSVVSVDFADDRFVAAAIAASVQ